MKLLVRGTAVAFCVAVMAPGAFAQPQDSDQQRCINKINKAMIKLQAQQGKENSGCLKDYVKGVDLTSVGGAEGCLTADRKGKVADRSAKTVSDESKNCVPADLPNFAYTSAANVNSVAVAQEVALMHDVYGNPIDNTLQLCDPNEQVCLCQRQASDRIEKIFRAAGKIFLKCKKAALEVGKDPFPVGAASPAEVATCVIGPSAAGLSVQEDTKQKIANAVTQLGDTLSQFCGSLPSDAFANGNCAGNTGPVENLSAATTCLSRQAKCRFCKMVELGDGLSIDCNTWSGGTCD